MSSSANMRSRSSLRSRSLFLGNMPDTAWRMICAEETVKEGDGRMEVQRTSSGFRRIMSLYWISFKPPGNIVWCR